MTAPTRVRVLLASTLYGAATLAAATDSGCFDPVDRCVLLVSNNAAVPETTPPLDAMPGFPALRDRFDEVRSWNEAIAPFHPGGWSPRPNDVPLWERHLRTLWDLGDARVELVVESLQVEPALALVQLFPAAPIDVYADGLMSYGPTRNKLDPLVTTRVRRLLHLDLVPGLLPLLLTEHGVPSSVIPTPAFTKVLTELAERRPEAGAAPAGGARAGGAACGSGADGPAGGSGAADPADGSDVGGPADGHGAGGGSGPALLLGQYLAALGILTPQEEEDLHLRMLRGAVERGHRRVVFKPHPTAPADWSLRLAEEADRLGAELTVHDTPELAEVLFQHMRPALVVGCFSTALITANAFYGIPAVHTGTDLLLERLTPFQNSNRVPVTLVDALLPSLDSPQHTPRSAKELPALLTALGFCMQPVAHPHLRRPATAYLAAGLDDRTRRYFKRKRLAALGLPGALPAGLTLPRNRVARRVARRLRHVYRARRRTTQRTGTRR